MTIRDLVEKAGSSVTVKVKSGKNVVCSFDSDYHKCIIDMILDLEVDKYFIENKLMSKPNITIMVEGVAGVKSVLEMQEALEDENIKTIILTDDIEGDAGIGSVALMTHGDKTLYLNGHNITAASNDAELECVAIHVTGGTLKIMGDEDSLVFGNWGGETNMAVWADGDDTRVYIVGGVYNTGLNSLESESPTIYATYGAEVYIYDGSFLNEGADSAETDYPFVLDIAGDAKIVCYGGSFKSQNPASGTGAEGSTFLADGYTVEAESDEDGTWYCVVAE